MVYARRRVYRRVYRRPTIPGFRGDYHPAFINGPSFTARAHFRRGNKRFATGPRRVGPVSQQVKSLQAYIKKTLPELKNKDVDLDVTNLTTAGSVLNVTNIDEGTEAVDRVGDSITVHSIIFKGSTVPATGGTSRYYHRIALVQDTQTISDTPPAANIIFLNADPIIALPNLDTLQRFKILWMSDLLDNGLGFNKNVTADGAFQSGAYEGYWQGNIKVSFNGATGSDIQKNAIYLVTLTTDTNNTLDFDNVARVQYVDS